MYNINKTIYEYEKNMKMYISYSAPGLMPYQKEEGWGRDKGKGKVKQSRKGLY